MLSEVEVRRPIYEFPDVWAKGNAGEELSPYEAVIYRTLIEDFNTFGFRGYNSSIRLDSKGGANAALWDMAGFLYENPGARREWDLLRDKIRRYREPHVTGQYSNTFEEGIRAALEVLETTYDP
jgi:hypothetical protein